MKNHFQKIWFSSIIACIMVILSAAIALIELSGTSPNSKVSFIIILQVVVAILIILIVTYIVKQNIETGFRQTKQKKRSYQEKAGFNDELRIQPDISSVMQTIIHFFDKKFSPEYIALYLSNHNNSVLNMAAFKGFDKKNFAPETIRAYEEKLYKIVAQGKIAVRTNSEQLNDSITIHKINETSQLFGDNDALIIPLIFKGKAVGVLELILEDKISDNHYELTELLKDDMGFWLHYAATNRQFSSVMEETKTQLVEMGKYKNELKNLEIILNDKTLQQQSLQETETTAVESPYVEEPALLGKEVNPEISLQNLRFVQLKNKIEHRYSKIAERKGLGFAVYLGNNLPETILTDATKLEQLLDQLITNAVQNTNDGGIKIKIRRLSPIDEYSSSHLSPETALSVSITDTGTGFSKTLKEELTNRFSEAVTETIPEKTTNAEVPGLSLCNQLTRMLNGEIHFKSKQGEGSTVLVSIPLNADSLFDDEDEVSTKHYQNDGIFFSKENSFIEDDRNNLKTGDKVVLLAIENRIIAEFLCNLVQVRDFKCLVTNDENAVYRYSEIISLDAVIIDIGSEKLNGWNIIKRLKSERETAGVPVHYISLTEQNMQLLNIIETLDFINAPFSSEIISSKIKTLEEKLKKNIHKLLIVNIDQQNIESLINSLPKGIEIKQATTQNTIEEETVNADCVLLPADNTALCVKTISNIAAQDEISGIPILLFINNPIDSSDISGIHKIIENDLIKSGSSYEKLISESMLFLYSIENK